MDKYLIIKCQKRADKISVIIFRISSECSSRNLKGRIWSFFDPCVDAMGWQPFWQSRMEASYLTSSPYLARYACVRLSPRKKGNTRLTNCLAGLAVKKSGGTITRKITHLHTWRQDHDRFPLSISLIKFSVIIFRISPECSYIYEKEEMHFCWSHLFWELMICNWYEW